MTAERGFDLHHLAAQDITEIWLPKMFNIFGKRRPFGRPPESASIECTHAAIGRHAVSACFAVLPNEILHAETHGPAFETERVADHLSNFLE